MRRRRSNAGIFQRLLEGGSRTTYHGKIRDRKGKRTAQVRQGKQSVYKGVRIIPVGNGEFETSLDSSRFESKRDARRFVDSWKKQGNPGREVRWEIIIDGDRHPVQWTSRKDAWDQVRVWRKMGKLRPNSTVKVVEVLTPNPRGHKGDFSRCVKAVSQRKGAKDPEAICAAQERKRGLLNPGTYEYFVYVKDEGRWRDSGEGPWDNRADAVDFANAEVGVKWKIVRKRRNPGKRNPADAAMAVSEEFHGRKVKAMIPVSQKRHYHKYLAELGELRKLEVLARDGRHRVTLSKFDGAMLCTNEDKNQLFLVGGDQGVDLRDFGIKDAHETETLGEVTKIEYFTDKEHLGSEGGEAVYVHKFRTTNGARGHKTVRLARNPDLIYYLRDEHLEFSGGSYFIRAEGIDL